MATIVRSVVAALAFAGCSVPTPAVSLGPDVVIDCGPIVDRASCVAAATVAATAKINPPPIAALRIRRPNAVDACVNAFHACDAEDVIVSIQSGDTLQDVALKRTTTGWVRLDLIR